MNDEIKFMSIERLMEIKSEYAKKACEENGENKRTNDILWYASYAINAYNRFGLKTNIKKDIQDFRNAVGEMVLNFKELKKDTK